MNFVFTVVHPNSIKYFKDFIFSINHQKEKKFILYICFNGIKNIEKYTKKIKVDYLYVKLNSTPTRARITSLKKIMLLKPNTITFLDSDDYMKLTRLKIVLNKIRNYDFLVHNLILLKRNNLINKNWFNIKNNSSIKIKDIHFKNFIGNSNLTIKGYVLKKIINKIGPNLKVFDWCLAKLLLLNKYKGIYISNSLSNYRLHSNNFSNYFLIKKKFIIKEINVKLENLIFFEKDIKIYSEKIKELILLKKNIQKKNFFKKFSKNLKFRNYWWSLTLG
jgi:hypothetical protein